MDLIAQKAQALKIKKALGLQLKVLMPGLTIEDLIDMPDEILKNNISKSIRRDYDNHFFDKINQIKRYLGNNDTRKAFEISMHACA